MFTEAERLRAIELYFKYGRKLAPVVRELGYPSKRNLRRWIRLWEASDGATKAIRRKPRYSDVQKQAAVEHYLNHGGRVHGSGVNSAGDGERHRLIR